ncbi:hypothetical protein [Eubacterium sp.]|uniref:hypothetical protein n=1 Tax=Eubacterium sp. TaxID=142586 RepID=UPI0025D23769|nr:hypothetical protein [Eubacterium sp.]MCR5628734.1 hypothetical protein [Eubacterium sp.]
MDEKLLDEILEENGSEGANATDEVTSDLDVEFDEENNNVDINSLPPTLEGEYPDETISEIVNGSSSRYVNISDKYEDAKSTAGALTVFGVLGLSVMGLSMSGVLDKFIKLPFNPKENLLNCITMGGMFIVFTVIGIRYIFKAKEYEGMLGKEKSDYDKITEWLKTSVQKDIVPIEGSEEELYFKRSEVIKDRIMRAYEDVDENLIEKLIDDNYDDIFSK